MWKIFSRWKSTDKKDSNDIVKNDPDVVEHTPEAKVNIIDTIDVMSGDELLKAVAAYVRKGADREVLIKMSETISIAGMLSNGRLDKPKEDVFNEALDSWIQGIHTPREFKGLFRGGR